MLEFVRETDRRSKRGEKFAIFHCTLCNREKEMKSCSVLSGKTKACGCQKGKNIKHGMCKTSEYRSWGSLKNRCCNPTNKAYEEYGGRGIKVCERWLNSFENFYADMGDKPPGKRTIERRDNNGDYCLENCYWATQREQNNNKRDTTAIPYNNKTQNLSRWSEELNIPMDTLWHRLNQMKWTVEKAFSTQVRPYKNRTAP